MNLNVSGHHLEVTPAIRSYVRTKLERVTRHFDHVIDAHVILTVNKVRQKAEVTLHVRGKDLHCESEEDRGERHGRAHMQPGCVVEVAEALDRAVGGARMWPGGGHEGDAGTHLRRRQRQQPCTQATRR